MTPKHVVTIGDLTSQVTSKVAVLLSSIAANLEAQAQSDADVYYLADVAAAIRKALSDAGL